MMLGPLGACPRRWHAACHTSQSDEEHTLIGTPSGSAAGSEGYSGFEEAYKSEEISTSHSPIVTNTPVSALSDEADSVDFTPAPLTDVPAPIADQHNRWYVEGQYHVYRDAKLLNDKVVVTRTLTVERQVLIGSLCTVPDVNALFTRHRLEWIARSVGRYNEEVV